MYVHQQQYQRAKNVYQVPGTRVRHIVVVVVVVVVLTSTHNTMQSVVAGHIHRYRQKQTDNPKI